MEATPFLDVRNEYVMQVPVDFRWLLRGISSKVRRSDLAVEKNSMLPLPQLGRERATCACFIAMKRQESWWDMNDDEKSSHAWIGEDFYKEFPTVARQLHHCRELGEPFDFITWLEYFPEDEPKIDAMLASFRDSEEWQFVEREIDLRLVRREDYLQAS